MAKSGVAFHCHHDRLVEFVTNYDERVAYIKQEKPPAERPLRLRHRLLFQQPPDCLLIQVWVVVLCKECICNYPYELI